MSQGTFLDTLIRLEAFKRIFVFRPRNDFFRRGKSMVFWSKINKYLSFNFLLLLVSRDLCVS